MILTKEEITEIISNPAVDTNMLLLIRQYIYDMKQVDVGEIVKPVSHSQLMLMNIAYGSAVDYYREKNERECEGQESCSL